MSAATGLTQEECLTQLASIAGDEHTRLTDEAVAVAPADARQIAEVLRFANANGIAVTPSGSGTKARLGQSGGGGHSFRTEADEAHCASMPGKT